MTHGPAQQSADAVSAFLGATYLKGKSRSPVKLQKAMSFLEDKVQPIRRVVNDRLVTPTVHLVDATIDKITSTVKPAVSPIVGSEWFKKARASFGMNKDAFHTLAQQAKQTFDITLLDTRDGYKKFSAGVKHKMAKLWHENMDKPIESFWNKAKELHSAGNQKKEEIVEPAIAAMREYAESVRQAVAAKVNFPDVQLYNKMVTTFNRLVASMNINDISRGEFIEAVKADVGKVWADSYSELASEFLNRAKHWYTKLKVKADAALPALPEGFDSRMLQGVTVNSALNKTQKLAWRATGAVALLSHKALDVVHLPEAKKEKDEAAGTDKATLMSVVERMTFTVKHISAKYVQPRLHFDPVAVLTQFTLTLVATMASMAKRVSDVIMKNPLAQKSSTKIKELAEKPEVTQIKEMGTKFMDTPLTEMPEHAKNLIAETSSRIRQRLPGATAASNHKSEEQQQQPAQAT
jgi:hypothetical protein